MTRPVDAPATLGAPAPAPRSPRGRGWVWAAAGAAIGALAALPAFAPASWLARAVASASEGRVVLAQARGTLWSGSALVVLTGGAQSRDARALPDRLHWQLGWATANAATAQPGGLALTLTQACCLDGPLRVGVQPSFSGTRLTLPPRAQWLARWPADALSGLGTPWNTLQLSGHVRVSAPQGLTWTLAPSGGLMRGTLDADFVAIGSRLTTLDTLGSYRLSLTGSGQGPLSLRLSTQEGALQLHGEGMAGGGARLRFTGEASATAEREAALNNLLNIIGRRQGARSIITIG